MRLFHEKCARCCGRSLPDPGEGSFFLPAPAGARPQKTGLRSSFGRFGNGFTLISSKELRPPDGTKRGTTKMIFLPKEGGHLVVPRFLGKSSICKGLELFCAKVGKINSHLTSQDPRNTRPPKYPSLLGSILACLVPRQDMRFPESHTNPPRR